jgi:nitrogen fixation protein NifU and related proteins
MDIRELYQEVIMDHNRYPRNHREMGNATCAARGHNPLCGDELTVYLHMTGELIDDVSFVGCGCAISQASASLMTESVKGKTLREAHDLFETFHQMMTQDDVVLGKVDKLTVLMGVKTYPARVKCATLAWHTLEAALKQEKNVVNTEIE